MTCLQSVWHAIRRAAPSLLSPPELLTVMLRLLFVRLVSALAGVLSSTGSGGECILGRDQRHQALTRTAGGMAQ